MRARGRLAARLDLLGARTAVVAAILLWGLAPVATRYLVLRLPPLSLITLRFLIAVPFFLLLCLPSLKALSWNDLRRLMPAAFLGVVGYYLPVTFGVQRISASTAGLILATEPGWILLIAHLLRERVLLVQWLGVGISFIGVVLLFLTTSSPVSGRQDLLGELLVLLSAVVFAVYTVYFQRISRVYGAMRGTALSTVLGAIPLVPLLFTLRASQLEGFGLAGWAALFLLAIGSTLVAMILWNQGVAGLGGAAAGPYLYGVPLVSVFGGYALLAERLSLAALASGALIIGGLALPQVVIKHSGGESAPVPATSTSGRE